MPKDNPKDTNVILRIESSRKKRWKETAAKQGLSMTDLITSAVERYVTTN